MSVIAKEKLSTQLEEWGVENEVAIIVAVAENRVVGRAGELPWRLSSDLRHFKANTEGKVVIMGRKTYESIGHSLPNRTNLVVTREGKPEDFDDRCQLYRSLKEALVAADRIVEDTSKSVKPEIMIIGGAEIYKAALPLVSRIYLTEVHASLEGDAYFPPLDFTQWRGVSRQRFVADEKNQFDYSFVTLER